MQAAIPSLSLIQTVIVMGEPPTLGVAVISKISLSPSVMSSSKMETSKHLVLTPTGNVICDGPTLKSAVAGLKRKNK